MNGLIKAAQPFAGMDLLWKSGRRAGQVFLSSSLQCGSQDYLIPLIFQAWISSWLDLSPLRRRLAPGLGCVCWLGVGLWVPGPSSAREAVRGRERGPAPGVLPVHRSHVSVGLLGLVL